MSVFAVVLKLSLGDFQILYNTRLKNVKFCTKKTYFVRKKGLEYSHYFLL